MAVWPEIVNVKKDHRCELLLSGASVSERLEKYGLSDNLFSCTSLNFLQIAETCLSEIPPKIKSLYNLTSLVLHSNNLKELCPEIGELVKLKLLNVSNNQIEKLPKEICKLEALTTLNVSSNKIEKIPDLSNNKMLSSIDFSYNLLDDMSELCHSHFTHLSELNLKGNKIKTIPFNVKDLTALKILNISNNELSIIAGELGSISKLKEIDLQGNPLSDKKLSKLVTQGKAKQILDYIRDHCVRENSENAPAKGRKGKNKMKSKPSQEEQVNLESDVSCKNKIVVSRSDNGCSIKRTKFIHDIRPHILACVMKNVTLNIDTLKKFIQLQSKLHDGICEKRNVATIATHDLSLCKGNQFTYTALSPDTLKITPLSRNKEFTGKELFLQLQTEAENLRKEKKRNTYFGIHKFLHLLDGKTLYPCLLNSENNVISFPPLTNSDLTKISINTKDILIEVTSSTSQANCKKVLDVLLKETVQLGIGTISENDCCVLNVETVRVEELDGTLIAVYPSKIDLEFDNEIQVIRN